MSNRSRMAPGPLRAYLRSLTYPGIAQAMAEQWAPVFAQALLAGDQLKGTEP